ncbi:hypothetical protein [Paenibacillus wynnii]|uniref:hypothetical protein n=1 Tax=Paenibacillus wynnii TaxID=268407 RepID=UPI0027D7CD86|nr:hypothetical protein [Paenibacillus wynnii]
MPASRKEVIRIYGEPAFNDQDSLTYNFEAVGDRLQAMSMFKQLDNRYWKNIKYSLTFLTNESNLDQIEYFILHDFDFFFTMSTRISRSPYQKDEVVTEELPHQKIDQ